MIVEMFRYVFKYTEDNLNEKFNYQTEFSDLKDSVVSLQNATWHLAAKCRDSKTLAVESISLQKRVGGVWYDFTT